MNKEALSRQFDKELIKQKPGPRGTDVTYPYVVGAEYIKRLNEAFDFEWSFEIKEHHSNDKEVLVVGVLTTAIGVKQQFGGQRLDSRGELSDAYKGAVTDCLKKCASLFGIGLHLQDDDEVYSGGGDSGARGAAPASSSAMASAKQLDAIEAIARASGVSSDELDAKTRKEYGRVWEQLTKEQASKVIDWLKKRTTSTTSGSSGSSGKSSDEPPPIGDDDIPF